jgi:putative tricarboxylic transport membrane protein
VLRHRWLLLRSSLIGTVIGVIPGIGGTVASFVAYGHAVQSASDRSEFGKGDIRGIVAPEASHDAKDGGSLLPVLAFGLPGSESTVILLTAMLMHGLVPGKALLEQQLPLVFTLIWSLFLSNWLTSIIGLAVIRPAAKLARLRTDVLAPVILALVAISAVAYRGRQDDLVVALGFGVIGYLMIKFDWPRVPLVIAFVLGGMLENNLQLAIRLISLGRVSLFDRPQALVITALIVATVVWMLRTQRGAPAVRAST